MDFNLPKDVSAQVILKSIGLTSPADIANEFERAGFHTGALRAGSFSITAPPKVFEERLGVHLEITPQGDISVAGRSGPARYELPLDRLSPTIIESIQAIVFTPKPDFGPGGDF